LADLLPNLFDSLLESEDPRFNAFELCPQLSIHVGLSITDRSLQTLLNPRGKSMRLLAAAFGAAFLLVASQPVAAANLPCTPAKVVAAEVFAKVHDASEHTLRDADAAELTRRLNAVPPPTDWAPADEVMIFTAPSKQPEALLFLFERGCARHRVTIPILMLNAILGQGS